MSGTIIAIIIGLVSLAFILNRKSNILYVLFFVIYMQGLFSIMGVSMPLVKATIEILIWVFFFLALFDRNTRSRHIPGIMIFIAFSIFYLIAILLSKSLNFDAYSYFRHYLNAFLMVSGAYMFNFSPVKLFRINRFVFFLFILQIVASIIKYIILGPYEEYVGTMIITTGSLNTVFPLIAIVYMIYAWFHMGRKPRYLLYVLGFLFMGWVGDKRGIYFYLVIILFLIFWKRFRDRQRGSFIPVTAIWWSPVIVAALIGIFYLGVRLTPSLNPEKKVWGSYNAKFLSSYIYVYNVKEQRTGDYRGRFGGTYLILYEFFTGNGIMIRQPVTATTLLTGFGADNYVGDVGERIIKQQKAGILRVTGIISTGFTQSLLATGILGVILMLWFYFYYIKKVSQISKIPELNPYWKTIASGTFMMGTIFILDYFTYSSTFNMINTVYLTFFWFIGQLIKPDLLDRYNIET